MVPNQNPEQVARDHIDELLKAVGIITRFTNGRDPTPRSREIFTFQRPETLLDWLEQDDSLRSRLNQTPPLNPDKLPASELGLRNCQETAITKLFLLFSSVSVRTNSAARLWK